MKKRVKPLLSLLLVFTLAFSSFAGALPATIAVPDTLTESVTVVIDGAHENQYVNGDYAGRLTTFSSLADALEINLVQAATLDAATLKDAGTLLITAPRRTPACNFTPADLNAVKAFTDAGGNLIVTGRADYGNPTDGSQTHLQLNALLSAVGATTRINNDEVVKDNTSNYTIFTDTYNRSHPVLKNLYLNKTMRFYSGASLVVDPAKVADGTVTAMVNGIEGCFSYDSDGQGSTPVGTGTNMYLMVSETLPSGAVVYICGVAFLNDYESDYDNLEISQAILRSLTGTEPDVTFLPETLGLVPGKNTGELNLNWYCDAAVTGTPAVAFTPQLGATLNFTGLQAAASAGKLANKVTVTGLQPDTTYGYRVSSDGLNWSGSYTYKTPKAASFRFAVTGDPQLTTGLQDNTSSRKDETTAKGWQDTVAAIAVRGVDFIAGVGDEVDMTNNGSEAEYSNFFAPDALRSLPFAPAVGNHDRHYLFNYHYNLPNEQSFTPVVNAGNAGNEQYRVMEVAANYYYLYNNALFVVLNDSGYPESKEVAAEYVSLYDKTLQAATEANADQYTWLFVQHHKSTASVADHIADTDIQYYVEAGFEKTMDKYGVDFVLAGHDHVYARSYPMLDGVPDKTGAGGTVNATLIKGGDGASTATNPNGTVYFTTTTGSGLKYYELFNNAGNLYVKNNSSYPYLVENLFGSLAYAGANIINNNPSVTGGTTDPALYSHEVGKLPLSAAKYLQNKTPGYIYVEVAGNTVSFNYYDIDEYKDALYDSYTVSKSTGLDPTTEINLFSFNDFHGTVDNSASASNPGMARFTAIAQHIMGQYPNSALLAAGDNYQGSAISNYFLGEPVSKMMKALDVKYSAAGNHDFDWGQDKLAKFSQDAGGMEFLAANVFLKGSNDRPDWCKPYATMVMDGKRVGLVGWAHTGTPTLVAAKYISDLEFRSNSGSWFIDAVDSWKAAENWDAVIALTHSTLSGANLAGHIDGIITGHNHSVSTSATNGIPTVQAGYNGRNLGRLQLLFDNAAGTLSVTSSTFANFTNATHLPVGTVDPQMQAVYDEYYSLVKPIFDEQVGVFGENIANSGQMAAWANRLVWEFLTRQTGEDDYVLIQNSGGWRSVDYGRAPDEPVDYWFLNTLMPFDNEIYLFQLKGEYLINFLNGTRVTGSGSLGSSPVITNAYKSGSDWYVGATNEKIDPEKLYKVSMNDFMFTGGDSYGVVANTVQNPPLTRDYAVYDYDTLIMGVPLREAMADELRFRSAPKVSAGVRTSEVSNLGEFVQFVFSLCGLDHLNTVAFEFTVAGGILEYHGLDPVNGFQAMPIKWTKLADSLWKGELTLVYPGGVITSKDALDIVRIFFNATAYGDASITLNSAKVTMQPKAGGEIVSADAAIETEKAATSVVKVYSKYDLNKDGQADQADLAIVALACSVSDSNPLWNQKVAEDSHGDPVTYAMCDVNNDGRVDMLDLLDVFLNYTGK